MTQIVIGFLGLKNVLDFQNSTAVEQLSIRTALQICLDQRMNRMEVHSDSIEAISLNMRENGRLHPLWKAISQIQKLMSLSWEVVFHHSYREDMK